MEHSLDHRSDERGDDVTVERRHRIIAILTRWASVTEVMSKAASVLRFLTYRDNGEEKGEECPVHVNTCYLMKGSGAAPREEQPSLAEVGVYRVFPGLRLSEMRQAKVDQSR